MTSFAQFTVNLDRAYDEKVEQRVAKVTRWVALEALRRVIMKSPVDTGRLRGNWQAAVNVRPDGVLEVVDKAGQSTVAKGMKSVSALPPFATVYIANNLDYASAIENGHSQQAPQGMVAVTVAELQEFFANIPPETNVSDNPA